MLEGEKAKDRVKEQFSRNAEKYVESESHARGKDLPVLLQWIEPQSHWQALDIATGGGHVAKALAPFVNYVYATDLTKGMLENTAKHLRKDYSNIGFIVADAESLPFVDQSFDVVTCRIAPHHFPNPQKFIAEAARVLKDEGLFLMIDNVSPELPFLADFLNTLEYLRDESHARCLTVDEWRTLLKANRLQEVKAHLRRKTQNYPVWLERTASGKEQRERVNKFVLAVDENIKDYFNIKIQGEFIRSFEEDEWMVLCRKNRK